MDPLVTRYLGAALHQDNIEVIKECCNQLTENYSFAKSADVFSLLSKGLVNNCFRVYEYTP